MLHNVFVIIMESICYAVLCSKTRKFKLQKLCCIFFCYNNGKYLLWCIVQYDYIFMTKIVTVTDWPDTSPPQYNVFSMIEAAIEWQSANDIGPVIVMDR